MERCAGDVILLPPHDMPNPSPSPLHDDSPHAVLIAASKKLLIGDGIWPKDAQYSSEVLCVEGGQFLVITLSHPPTF